MYFKLITLWHAGPGGGYEEPFHVVPLFKWLGCIVLLWVLQMFIVCFVTVRGV